MQINVNPIYCKTTPSAVLKNALAYQKEIYIRSGPNKGTRKVLKSLMAPDGKFPTGLLPRVLQAFNAQNVSYQIHESKGQTALNAQEPKLTNIVFKPEQLSMIQTALMHKRGILQAPTGLGKTIAAAGIISCYPKHRCLFLCHTISLLTQTIEVFKSLGIGKITAFYGDEQDLTGDVIVGTVQAVKNLDGSLLSRFHIVIVDECHHITNIAGMYAQTLAKVSAIIRIGFSATPAKRGEAQLVAEGWLGPILYEVTLDAAIQAQYLATPKVKIIKLPTILGLKTVPWKDVQDRAITNNIARNRRIIRCARKLAEEGKTSLIYVQRIQHGQLLMQLIGTAFRAYFVHGTTTGTEREYIKKALQEKRIDCVIATTVWKEGVNIPSLNAIINAAEGKSEKAIMQTIGRGLRRTESKTEVLIIDFFDPSNNALIAHFGERLCLYMDKGWL